MRKSKSWAPSRGGATCAGAEDATGCCCDADTPGAGDSCAGNDNKLSCRVASMQIGRATHTLAENDNNRSCEVTNRQIGRAKYTRAKRTLMWEGLPALCKIPSSRVRLLQTRNRQLQVYPRRSNSPWHLQHQHTLFRHATAPTI